MAYGCKISFQKGTPYWAPTIYIRCRFELHALLKLLSVVHIKINFGLKLGFQKTCLHTHPNFRSTIPTPPHSQDEASHILMDLAAVLKSLRINHAFRRLYICYSNLVFANIELMNINYPYYLHPYKNLNKVKLSLSLLFVCTLH